MVEKNFETLKLELRGFADIKKADIYKRFFKTAKGEYGYGDKFLGVVVPKIRGLVAKYFRIVSFDDVKKLLKSEWHEERLLGLLILVEWTERKQIDLDKIKDLYWENLECVNNWDLVDQSADKILGRWVYENSNERILFDLIGDNNLWKRRVGVMASFWFIKKGEGVLTLKLVEKLLNDKEDLIHKAAGWMLREVGKRINEDLECDFLDKYAAEMPRTMLRYAIERFNNKKRIYYLRIN